MAAGNAQHGSDAGAQTWRSDRARHQQGSPTLQPVAKPPARRFATAGRMDRIAGPKRRRSVVRSVVAGVGADASSAPRAKPASLLPRSSAQSENARLESQ